MPFALRLALYVLIVGRTWEYYAAALVIFAFSRHQGRLTAVLLRLGIDWVGLHNIGNGAPNIACSSCHFGRKQG